MDPMVVKYLGLAAITYGTHAYLAVAQLMLCAYLVTGGIIILLEKKSLGRWARRFGLIVGEDSVGGGLRGWLMILTGVTFILPLFGISYWLAVAACPVALYCLLTRTKDATDPQEQKIGGVVRKGLALSAVLIFGFTIWEGRDLVFVGWDVNYKAIYWRHKEVTVWQKENNPHVPKVGEMAPDFELIDVTGASTMRLSDFRGEKPVVLLFGSFT